MGRGIIIRVKEGESPEAAIRRLKRRVEDDGKPRASRKYESYHKKSAIRKQEQAAARKRFLKKLLREQQNLRVGSR